MLAETNRVSLKYCMFSAPLCIQFPPNELTLCVKRLLKLKFESYRKFKLSAEKMAVIYERSNHI